MIVTEVPSLSESIILALEEDYRLEKPMPHLTELIYCLTRSYWDRFQPVPSTDNERLMFAIGIGLERSLLRGNDRPEPRQVRGIWLSPDSFILNSLEMELKTTRASIKTFASNGFPESWLKQIKAYCLTVPSLSYRLVVLHLMGNYSPPFPMLKSYELTFDWQELQDNWEWLEGRRDAYQEFILSETPPDSFTYNEDWECTNCRYLLRCQARTGQVGPKAK